MTWTREKMAEWRKKNKAHISAYGKQYRRNRSEAQVEVDRARDRLRCAKTRTDDREKYNQRLREWCANNPKRTLEKNNRWRRDNPDAVRAAKARRRAKPIDGISFTERDLAVIRRLQRNRCGYCRSKLTPKTQHIDHIIALACGGTNHRSNIQLLCSGCNQRKSKRDPIEFAQSMGMLV